MGIHYMLRKDTEGAPTRRQGRCINTKPPEEKYQQRGVLYSETRNKAKTKTLELNTGLGSGIWDFYVAKNIAF
jgi:hypothetical protein